MDDVSGGQATTSDELILQADKVFRWDGLKRKQTLFSAHLGRLVLTNDRLLFLSTGKNDVNAKRLIGGAASPLAALHTSGTSQLDMSALTAKGGLAIDRSSITSAELKGMFKVLTITFTDTEGAQRASTFAPKNGGMPDGAAWVAALTQ